MARYARTLSSGRDNTDHLSTGVLALCFPLRDVQAVIDSCGRASRRIRDLPAAVVAYYVIAMSLYPSVGYEGVLRWMVKGLQWLRAGVFRVSTKAALSAARQKLGEQPMREIFNRMALPLNARDSKGSFWKGFHVVAVDGSTLALQDTEANRAAFGRPSNQHGEGGYPLARFVVLAEVGTHLIFEAEIGSYHQSEIVLAEKIVSRLQENMLCLADRLYPSYSLWKQASATGAHLLWRSKSGQALERLQTLADGSWLARWKDPNSKEATTVRVIEYRLKGGATTVYRLLTTILNPAVASASELAAFYPQRWEVELAFRETKQVLRNGQATLRSKVPELVRQEFWGLLLAHYLVRKMMAQAALDRKIDPDELSFQDCVTIVHSSEAGHGLSITPSATDEDAALAAGRHGQKESEP